MKTAVRGGYPAALVLFYVATEEGGVLGLSLTRIKKGTAKIVIQIF